MLNDPITVCIKHVTELTTTSTGSPNETRHTSLPQIVVCFYTCIYSCMCNTVKVMMGLYSLSFCIGDVLKYQN